MSIHAKKSLGQNFLVNPHILDKIISAAEVSKDDIILEVGPGTGNLTKKLAEKVLQPGSGQAGKVIAIEKDHRLITYLKNELSTQCAMAKSVEIVEGDILKFPISNFQFPTREYKIVANIPYYITSNFLRKIFEEWPKPALIVLTIQKEVAQRIMARPPHMNLLALSIQYSSEPEIIGYISKNNFRPVPKVDSAIIRLRPRFPDVELPLEVQHPRSQDLFKLIRIGFSEKRKQLANILSKKLKVAKNELLEDFKKMGVKETARAENLSLEEWQNLKSYLFK